MKNIPFDDVRSLFQELFCYLLVAGLFEESYTGIRSFNLSDNEILSREYRFRLIGGSPKLGEIIAEGIRTRVMALLAHLDVNEQERKVLGYINTLFNGSNRGYGLLRGTDFRNIALLRNFDPDMAAVAHYVGVGYGQSDFGESAVLPRLYISVFGNIHLSVEDKLIVSDSKLIYGSNSPDGDRVTFLWSFLSAQLETLGEACAPGDLLGDMLTTLCMITPQTGSVSAIGVPKFATSLHVSRMLLGKTGSIVGLPMATSAYKELLYGTLYSSDGTLRIVGAGLFRCIIDLMMKEYNTQDETLLFNVGSEYRKLFTEDKLYIGGYIPSEYLEYALEALDSDVDEEEADKDGTNQDDPNSDDSEVDGPTSKSKKSDDDTASSDVEEDPETSDNGYDPSVAAPAVPNDGPAMTKNNIGIISFDRTGENVDDDLYRSAVVALNDRLRADDKITISADVRDALDYWVNGYLYLAAISSTKEQINTLGLQQFLKNI